MPRILILLSMLPILGAFLLGHFFGVRKLRKAVRLSKSLEELLEFLAKKGIRPKIKFKRLAWSGSIINSKDEVCLPNKWKNSNNSTIVAQAFLRIGIQRLLKDYPDVVKWRMKVVRAGYIIPPFLILIAVFAMVVSRIPSNWTIALAATVIATLCILLWTTRSIEKEAAHYAITVTTRTRMLSRLSEEEALVESLKAWTWANSMPSVCLSIALGNIKERLE